MGVLNMQNNNEYEIVEYQNQLNEVPFKKFTEADFNLFFSIILLAKNKFSKGNIEKDDNGNFKIVMDYTDIKKISGLGKSHIKNQEFHDKYLKSMTAKLLSINGTISMNNGKIADDIGVFPRFRRNLEDATLTAFLNENFYKLLYDFDEIGFTQLEFKRFIRLESKYTKTLFRKLSQFRRSGKYVVKQEEFRELFDIPESYKQSDIMKRVINPSIAELSNDFKNLKCELHHAPKRGAPVDRYTFTFAKPKKEQKKTTEGQQEMIFGDNNVVSYEGQAKNKKTNFHKFEQNDISYDDLESELIDN